MPKYIVCQRVDGTGTRLEIKGQAEANSPAQAATIVGVEGNWVAVPVRNWSEGERGTETVERTYSREAEADLSSIPLIEMPDQVTIDEVLAANPEQDPLVAA